MGQRPWQEPEEEPTDWWDFQILLESHPHGLRVKVVGDLDIATAPRLNEVLDRLPDQEHGLLSLDLERVSFIDCRGLSSVLRAQQAAAGAGRRFTIRCTAPQVRRLFELTRLAQHFTFE